MPSADPAQIAAVRRFNRFYTRQIGLLRKSYLGSPYSLTEARVLYELAQHKDVTAVELARNLDFDAGYLSRVLMRFEKRGLVKIVLPKMRGKIRDPQRRHRVYAAQVEGAPRRRHE